MHYIELHNANICVPEYAKYVAIDGDGRTFAYEKMPVLVECHKRWHPNHFDFELIWVFDPHFVKFDYADVYEVV